MAYTEAAKSVRKCLGTNRDGSPCRAWAVWDDPRQLCVNHCGRHQRGHRSFGFKRKPKRKTPTCCCAAYRWPHRRGGGLCRWPDPPAKAYPIKAGTPSGERFRVNGQRCSYKTPGAHRKPRDLAIAELLSQMFAAVAQARRNG